MSTAKSDTHWNYEIPAKSRDESNAAHEAYKTAKLYVRRFPVYVSVRVRFALWVATSAPRLHETCYMQSCFVKARDGTKLAVDIMLPSNNPGSAQSPCALFQAR